MINDLEPDVEANKVKLENEISEKAYPENLVKIKVNNFKPNDESRFEPKEVKIKDLTRGIEWASSLNTVKEDGTVLISVLNAKDEVFFVDKEAVVGFFFYAEEFRVTDDSQDSKREQENKKEDIKMDVRKIKIVEADNLVCAIKYSDFNKIKYEIKNFDNSSIAIKNDFIITHQGRCGACSTLNDLAIYLSINLTVPTRQCGMLATFSESKGLKCLKDIGFSDHCAQIWLFNTKNTRKHCFMVCLVSWILNEPFTNKDGSLNECLQCDENQSGPIFKYFSGRTRRNSGIRSEIDRPTDQ
ncbi:unnamed protein product, partial [Brachionus calyciflorus]